MGGPVYPRFRSRWSLRVALLAALAVSPAHWRTPTRSSRFSRDGNSSGHQLCTLGYVDPDCGSRSPPATAAATARSPTRRTTSSATRSTSATTPPTAPSSRPTRRSPTTSRSCWRPMSRSTTSCPVAACCSRDPGLVATPGEPVCHFGVVTGESCGTVEAVNNGWFTMGQRRGQPEGRLRRAGLPHRRPRTARDRRDLQQRLGQFPGGGVVAGHHPADPPGRGRRRPGYLAGRGEREHRDRRRRGSICSSSESRRQARDVPFDLPVPPVQVAPEQLAASPRRPPRWPATCGAASSAPPRLTPAARTLRAHWVLPRGDTR